MSMSLWFQDICFQTSLSPQVPTPKESLMLNCLSRWLRPVLHQTAILPKTQVKLKFWVGDVLKIKYLLMLRISLF